MFKDETILMTDIKNLAVNDYLNGMSYRMVGEKYGVNHKTVRRWVIKSGNKSRDRIEALIVAGKKLRGFRRSPGTEFKKGEVPWNKDTKGIMKANAGSFKPGERISQNTEFKRGESPWNVGVPCSEDTKKKLSKAMKGKLSGDKHPNWMNGKSFEFYGQGFTSFLKESVRRRDGYKCKLCGRSQAENRKLLECHHIDYNKKNCDVNNLISLCKSCHMKTNFNRDYWESYFKGVLHVCSNIN